MMKRILLALAVVLGLLPSPARAGITCTLPITLQNGTVADAAQVMANFNAITACLLGNIAASGANNDITGLFALTTPIAPINGGTPVYIGSTSTGSANTQVISTTTPTNFTLSSGRAVMFTAGLTNTGATTVNVASSGDVNVFRRTASGPVAMIGGEIRANNAYVIVYDGTQWQLLTRHIPAAPTVQVLNSGTAATYTTPNGATWLEVQYVGGGGGGGVGGTQTSGATAGGSTTFNSISAAGGGAGGTGLNGAGGTTNPSCTVSAVGGAGAGGAEAVAGTLLGWGGSGGSSYFGGGAPGMAGSAGGAATSNTGGGGAGGGPNSSVTEIGGGGGGGGAYCNLIITNPAATYTYTVGAGGTGGVPQGGSFAGGAGGSGRIVVIEHYGG